VYNVALLELAAGDAASAAADLERLSRGEARRRPGSSSSSAGPATRTATPAALAAYEKAQTLGKADAGALERMGELYETAKRYPEAMDAFSAAVKADPKRAGAWFSPRAPRLVVASDAEQGLEALKSALDAGFSDKDAATALLAEPDLPEREKVVELLKAKGLAE
jgi:tetratricopeptide (TPR) repeat protein